jgi:hypothetical protein
VACNVPNLLLSARVLLCPSREHPGTLLPLFHGLFCLRSSRSDDVYAVVMSNVFAGV